MTLLSWTPQSSFLDDVCNVIEEVGCVILKGGGVALSLDGEPSVSLVWECQGPLPKGSGDWSLWTVQKCAQNELSYWEQEVATKTTEAELVKVALATSPQPGEVLVAICPCGCNRCNLKAVAARASRFAGIIHGESHRRLLFLVQATKPELLRAENLKEAATEAAYFKQQVVDRYPLLASAIVAWR